MNECEKLGTILDKREAEIDALVSQHHYDKRELRRQIGAECMRADYAEGKLEEIESIISDWENFSTRDHNYVATATYHLAASRIRAVLEDKKWREKELDLSLENELGEENP